MIFATPAGAVDLSGRWHLELTSSPPSPPFVELVQTGDSVTIPTTAFYQGSGAPENQTATLTGDSLSMASFYSLAALVKADGKVIHGHLTITLYPYGTSTAPFLATRCECFDGNAVDGDGCDASCRIEPCYDCSGDPSICVASSDGASCDDRRDCTIGETCSAGDCDGGTAVASCTDMTGRWSTLSDSIVHLIQDVRDVEQRGGLLRARTATGGLAEFGSIDPLTGAFELSVAGNFGSDRRDLDYSDLNRPGASCGNTGSTGMVSPEGQTFTSSGYASLAHRIYVHGAFLSGGCGDAGAFTRTGRRCASGECSAAPDECPPCQARTEEGACQTGPRQGCLRSLEPRRSSIKVADSATETGDRLRWKWRSGAAFETQLIGGPASGNGMQVCVFDESAAEPQLLFSSYADLEYGWEASATGLAFRRKTDAGKESVAWRPGINGKSSLLLTAVGGAADGSGLADGIDFVNSSWLQSFYPGLPHSPLDLPLRVQAVMDRGGACFESLFDSLGVRKNGDGGFMGNASQ